MIPLLDMGGLEEPPEGKLASKTDTLRLIMQCAENAENFNGIKNICCTIRKGKAICQVRF